MCMKNKFDQKVFERPKFPLGDILTWIAILFLVYVCVVFYAFSNTFDAVEVKGRSMLPTYNSSGGEDIVYTREAKYTYGDVVLIATDNKTIIKRVIGLAGDRIEFRFDGNNYHLYRNGTKLNEDYILNITGNAVSRRHLLSYKETHADEFDGEIYVVGENKVFVLGDNRADSKDSTYYGAFDSEQITAKVFYKVDAKSNPTLSIFFQIFFPYFYK